MADRLQTDDVVRRRVRHVVVEAGQCYLPVDADRRLTEVLRERPGNEPATCALLLQHACGSASGNSSIWNWTAFTKHPATAVGSGAVPKRRPSRTRPGRPPSRA